MFFRWRWQQMKRINVIQVQKLNIYYDTIPDALPGVARANDSFLFYKKVFSLFQI